MLLMNWQLVKVRVPPVSQTAPPLALVAVHPSNRVAEIVAVAAPEH